MNESVAGYLRDVNTAAPQQAGGASKPPRKGPA